MKTTDIPRLIHAGNWECDFSIVGVVAKIEDMIKEDGLQMFPDFQRGHVWSEEQQIAYIEQLLKGGCEHSKVIYLNHPSHKMSVKDGDYDDFVCVDGLQRFTALQRFVNNEIKVFGYYIAEYEDAYMFDRMKITVKININDLKTKKEVLQWYLQINNSGTPHSEEEINKVKNMLKECE